MERIIAVAFEAGMLTNAALFIPQAWKLWKSKSAEGVSPILFCGFCTLQLVGTLHGYFQHDHALMIGMLASLMTCGTATVLTLRYSVAA